MTRAPVPPCRVSRLRVPTPAAGAEHHKSRRPTESAILAKTVLRGAVSHEQRRGLLERASAWGSSSSCRLARWPASAMALRTGLRQKGPNHRLKGITPSAQGVSDRRRQLAARRKGPRRLDLVEILDDQQIRKINAHRVNWHTIRAATKDPERLPT